MSTENEPQGGGSLHDMAALCEAVILAEDWHNLPIGFNYKTLESMRLCDQLRRNFEAKYQLLQQLQALSLSTTSPESLSYITLGNPVLSFPDGRGNDTGSRLAVTGQIKLAYSTMILSRTYYKDAPPYEGPHLAVVLDTDEVDPRLLAASKLQPGLYTCFTPFKAAQVPDQYIPYLMN